MGYDFIIHDHCLSIYFTFSQIISFFFLLLDLQFSALDNKIPGMLLSL